MFWWLGCAENPEVRYARARDAQDAAILGEFCEAGRTEACGLAADALPAADPRRPGWDEKACDAGTLPSCLRRTTEPGDPYRVKACTLGDPGACLDAGDAARIAGDRTAAAERYAARCAAITGDAACLLAERMKAPAEPTPTGTPESIAAALWTRCDADEGLACLTLSELVETGGPLPPEAKSAQWLRDQACDLQVWYACAPHDW